MDQYRASHKANIACKGAIKQAIADNYRDSLNKNTSFNVLSAQIKELESQMAKRGTAETDRKLCQDADGLCGIPESRVQQKIPCGA